MASCKATCVLLSQQTAVTTVLGVLHLAEKDGVVSITGELTHLQPGKHGIAVCENGDVSDSTAKSCGPIFNPFGKTHGAPTDEQRMVGDLGNIVVDENGVAKVAITDKLVQLTGPHSVLGRSLVICSGQDDQGRGGHENSLVTGNAGPRVAAGVIGLVAS